MIPLASPQIYGEMVETAYILRHATEKA